MTREPDHPAAGRSKERGRPATSGPQCARLPSWNRAP